MTTTTPKSNAGSRWLHLRRIGLMLLAVLIIAFNGIAYMHAWAITHYAPVDTRTTRIREIEGWAAKARLLVTDRKSGGWRTNSRPSSFICHIGPSHFPDPTEPCCKRSGSPASLAAPPS